MIRLSQQTQYFKICQNLKFQIFTSKKIETLKKLLKPEVKAFIFI